MNELRKPKQAPKLKNPNTARSKLKSEAKAMNVEPKKKDAIQVAHPPKKANIEGRIKREIR